nr:hypothetical protein [Lysinibacillus timonensis]
MPENTVAKCIRKCLENVAENTLLNLHYYSNVKQIVFKFYNDKCGCIIGETLDGNLMFIQLDGIYYISVADDSPPLPSTNKKKKVKKVLKDISSSQSLYNFTTQTSGESQIEENNLSKVQMGFDMTEETKVKPQLKKVIKTNEKKVDKESALSQTKIHSINERNPQTSGDSQNKEKKLIKDQIGFDRTEDTKVKLQSKKKTKMYRRKADKSNSLSNSIIHSVNERNPQTSGVFQNKEKKLIMDQMSFDKTKETKVILPLKKKTRPNEKKVDKENALSQTISTSINENNKQSNEKTQHEEISENLSLDNLPEIPNNNDMVGNLNNRINSYVLKNLQIINRNGNSTIVDSGNFNKK